MGLMRGERRHGYGHEHLAVQHHFAFARPGSIYHQIMHNHCSALARSAPRVKIICSAHVSGVQVFLPAMPTALVSPMQLGALSQYPSVKEQLAARGLTSKLSAATQWEEIQPV